MPLDDLPKSFVLPTRQEILDRWLRDYRLRQPGADTRAHTQPYIDGAVVADTITPVYADAGAAGNNAALADKTSAALETEAQNLGIPKRLPAGGGAGFVIIAASAGGALILAGQEIRDQKTGFRYKCSATAVYFDKQAVPILGIDTGPATNLAAGSVLVWTSPPAGVGPNATILADPNGKGLTGGRDNETDPELLLRIQDARANPAASGNNAAVRRFAKEGAQKLGIPIQEVFVISDTDGPGSTAYVFTMRPATPGASRVPSNIQIAAILAHITGELPADDGLFGAAIIEQPIDVRVTVEWARAATGWIDAQQWPRYSDDFYVSAVTDPTHFSVETLVGSPIAPKVGQTFACYDAANGKFVRKRILTVTGSHPWVLVCDTTNNASDTVFAPAVNDRLCPWSDSLQLLVQPLLVQLGTLGPGEMFGSFFDAGLRQRRDPISPELWPSVLRNKDLELAFGNLPQLADVRIVAPTLPFATAVGTPSVSVNLLSVGSLLAFPI